MIRIDCAWLAVQPLDMRAGTDTALGRVVQVFGAAHAHHGYIFANARGESHKVAAACVVRHGGSIKADLNGRVPALSL